MTHFAGRGNPPLIDFGPDSRLLTHSSSSPSPGRHAWRPCPAGTLHRCWTLQFAAISCHTRRTSCARSSRGSRPARAHSTDNLRKPSLFSSHKSGTCRLRTHLWPTTTCKFLAGLQTPCPAQSIRGYFAAQSGRWGPESAGFRTTSRRPVPRKPAAQCGRPGRRRGRSWR